MQEVCYQACIKKQVHFTRDHIIELGQDIDVSEIIGEVVNQQTGRYNSFITQFAAGFQDTALEMYKWLMFPVLSATDEMLEEGLSNLRGCLTRLGAPSVVKKATKSSSERHGAVHHGPSGGGGIHRPR